MKRSTLVLALLTASSLATATEVVPAYNVYGSVPFVIDYQNTQKGPQTGLAFDLVRYLNDKLKGKYQFELQVMPRERLNQEVINKPDFKGVILFLNPRFVGDVEQKKYTWTASLMSDKNNVVSPVGKKLEYASPDSFAGLQFIGVRGNKYAGLEERFGKDIKRDDVSSELQSLKMIANGRGEATIMAATIYNYLMKVNGKPDQLEGKLHVSATPHLQFERHMFVANPSTELAKALEPVAAAMAKDKDWKAILAKYGTD